MKYKTKHLTRTYIYLDLLEYLIIHNEGNNNSIQNFKASEELNELFLEEFKILHSDIEMDMYHALLRSYQSNEALINKVREHFQHRHTIMMDKPVILIINLALAEYLNYKLDKKLLIKIYVDLAASFQESTDFIHGVLDKSLEYLINQNNSQNINE